MDNKLFEQLLKSVQQAGKISRGEVKAKRSLRYEELNIKAIRQDAGLTQTQFSTMIGISLRTLQNWEQGHRKPDGPALVLLKIIKNDPKHVFQTLHQSGH